MRMVVKTKLYNPCRIWPFYHAPDRRKDPAIIDSWTRQEKLVYGTVKTVVFPYNDVKPPRQVKKTRQTMRKSTRPDKKPNTEKCPCKNKIYLCKYGRLGNISGIDAGIYIIETKYYGMFIHF